jgi:hypothetical protein
MTAEPHAISSPPVSPPAAKRVKTESDSAPTATTITTAPMNISSIMDAPAAEEPAVPAAAPAPPASEPVSAAGGGQATVASRVTPVTLPPLLSEPVAAAVPALQIKKLSAKARLPTRGSAFAAGYDLYAARDTVIPARGKALVDTDLSMAVPAGTCMDPFCPFP